MTAPQEPLLALVVDDDPDVRRTIGAALRRVPIEVVEVACVAAARAALADRRFDVVLLDVGMPDESGVALLVEMRAAGDRTPVIIVSGCDTVEERVRGLRSGADDYLVKPFEPSELAARVEVALRRRATPAELCVGELRLDLVDHVAERGGRRIELSPREFELLRALASAGGRVMSRAALLRAVWGMSFDPGSNCVEVGVARLRRRLASTGPCPVETVAGRGYRLSAPRATT